TLGNITYQWMREGIDVSGETGPTYTIPSASASADNGAQIQVRVNVFLQEVVTDPVTLSVNEDTTPPTLVSAVADRSFTHVRLTFSEAMDPVSAGDPGLYQVCDS